MVFEADLYLPASVFHIKDYSATGCGMAPLLRQLCNFCDLHAGLANFALHGAS
jgi:hypothetical protein